MNCVPSLRVISPKCIHTRLRFYLELGACTLEPDSCPRTAATNTIFCVDVLPPTSSSAWPLDSPRNLAAAGLSRLGYTSVRLEAFRHLTFAA